MITNTSFYNEYKEEIVSGLAGGLAGGLVLGLVSGLASGLAWGLAWGLASGLVLGLAWGLASGLAGGLVLGLASGLAIILLNFNEALPFFSIFPNWLFLVLGIFVLIELFYWLDSKKPRGKERNSFILKKKFEATCEVMLGLSGIAQIYILIREININNYFPEILKWIGYIGAGLIGLGIVIVIGYLWLQANKLKYKRTSQN